MEKKITKATFKSFLRKNTENLFIQCRSSFDGMYDSVMPVDNPQFVPAIKADRFHENNCGVEGVWLVGQSGNSFHKYEKDGYSGIAVHNCCGSFIVATIS